MYYSLIHLQIYNLQPERFLLASYTHDLNCNCSWIYVPWFVYNRYSIYLVYCTWLICCIWVYVSANLHLAPMATTPCLVPKKCLGTRQYHTFIWGHACRRKGPTCHMNTIFSILDCNISSCRFHIGYLWKCWCNSHLQQYFIRKDCKCLSRFLNMYWDVLRCNCSSVCIPAFEIPQPT